MRREICSALGKQRQLSEQNYRVWSVEMVTETSLEIFDQSILRNLYARLFCRFACLQIKNLFKKWFCLEESLEMKSADLDNLWKKA